MRCRERRRQRQVDQSVRGVKRRRWPVSPPRTHLAAPARADTLEQFQTGIRLMPLFSFTPRSPSPTSPTARSSPSPSRTRRRTAASIATSPSGCAQAYPGLGRRSSSTMAEEESEHRRRLLELYQAALRRPHPADPPRGRPRLHPAEAALAERQLRHRRHARARRVDGGRGRQFLPHAPPRAATDPAVRKLLGDLADIEAGHEALARKLDGRRFPRRRSDEETRDRAPHFRPAGRPARPRRPDGRLGLDAGAGLRRRLRHPQQLGRRSSSAWPPRSAPASRWASPRRSPTTARSPAAASPGCAASSPV